jgi:LPS-assembly lipoprotein
VVFDVVDAAGATRVASQDIELTREYTYDVTAAVGSPAEQALLQDELRRDMQAAILRRLDAVLRAD